MLRIRQLLAAGLSLWLSQSASAQAPPRLGLPAATPLPAIGVVSTNQQLADLIARNLKQSGTLRGYTIDITCIDGQVTLTGTVADQLQRDEVRRIVQGVPGVDKVIDNLTLVRPNLLQVQNPSPAPEPAPANLNLQAQPQPQPQPQPQQRPGIPPDPLPIFMAAPASGYDLNPPRMPPYAWPSYAAYPNFSRCAYPQAYPHNAWPFIGPIYPFPKVPLGWRSVKLEWDDGYWWFSRTATKHDWWKLRYW